MPPKKNSAKDARPGRQPDKKAGRPKGLKNKNTEKKYSFDKMKYAIEMDLHMINVRNTGTEKEINELPYASRRLMCYNLGIPESTGYTK